MSRNIGIDFAKLKSYVNNYKINIENDEFWKILSQEHKKYFAYLTFLAEAQTLSSTPNTFSKTITDKQLKFLTESCSDLGNVLFIMSHGAYKAVNMMLRSSIETFIKGFVLDEIPDIDIEKIVFNLFNRSADLNYFNNLKQKKLLGQLKQIYGELCKDVHTATENNMQNITALVHFPNFDLDAAKKTSNNLTQLVNIFLTLLSLKYNEYFHAMYHRNKSVIILSIPKSYRPLIMNIE